MTSSEAKSEVTEAVENADAGQIEKNLEQDKQSDKSEHLTAEEKTPFIDEKVRTDK